MQTKARHHHRHHHHRSHSSNNLFNQKAYIILLLSFFIYLVYLTPCFSLTGQKTSSDSDLDSELINNTVPDKKPTATPKPTDTESTNTTETQKPTDTEPKEPIVTPEPEVPAEFSPEYIASVEKFVKNAQNKVEQLLSRIHQALQTVKDKISIIKNKKNEELTKLENAEKALNQKINLNDKDLDIEFDRNIKNRVKSGSKVPLILISMKSETAEQSVKVSDVIFGQSNKIASKEIKSQTKTENGLQMRCIKGPKTKFTLVPAFPEPVTQITINYRSDDEWPIKSAIKKCKITALLTKKSVYSAEIELEQSKYTLQLDKPIRFDRLIIETIDVYGGSSDECIDEVFASPGPFVN